MTRNRQPASPGFARCLAPLAALLLIGMGVVAGCSGHGGNADGTPSLPIAIAETGWIAEDLVIPAYNVDISGTAAWQADYIRKLLAEADRLNDVFVTWFTAVDYDTLWTDTPSRDPLARIWRDTGLFDALTSRSRTGPDWPSGMTGWPGRRLLQTKP